MKRISNDELADAMQHLGTFTLTDLVRKLNLKFMTTVTPSSMRCRLARLSNKTCPITKGSFISKRYKPNGNLYYTVSTLQANRMRDYHENLICTRSPRVEKSSLAWPKSGLSGIPGTTVSRFAE